MLGQFGGARLSAESRLRAVQIERGFAALHASFHARTSPRLPSKALLRKRFILKL
jgi:hypothetical protein